LRPFLFRGQSLWKNRASCGLRALSFSKPNTPESIGASSLHALQRNQAGNGITGTPTRAAGPFGSVSTPSSHGAGRSSLTPGPSSLRTAASTRGSAIGSHSGTTE
jgi:hypothetical protein